MTAESTRRGVPEATVGRLPGYLRALTALIEQDRPSVSSEELAALAGVRSAQVRKDLSHLGSYGVRGVGYDVQRLSDQISAELGLSRDWPVVIVGMGNLGRALASYGGLATRGFRVVALADNDPAVIGCTVEGLPVRALSDFADDPNTDPAGELNTDADSDADTPTRSETDSSPFAVGVITTPPEAAQGVADALVDLGVRSILNFAPCVLSVPDQVGVRNVDLSTELQILAFHQHQRTLAATRVDEVG